MEKIKIDFDEWLKTFVPVDPVYYAVYDKTNGVITGIYPEGSAHAIENKIKISRDMAESIIDGKMAMHNCFVDLASNDLEIIHLTSLKKIDDILHRIIDKKYTNIKDPDVIVRYMSKSHKLKFILSNDIRTKKIRWDGDTEFRFIISEYNDPHKIIGIKSFTLDEFYLTDIEFKIKIPFKNFSVFTKRIFKTYILERK